jgi:voltage-gated potassium channel
MVVSTPSSLRLRLYRQLDPSAWPKSGLSPLNRIICTLIAISVFAAVIETDPVVIAGNETLFQRLEWIFGAAFLIEYAARVWACGEDPRYGSSLSGRLRYMRSPAALIDLVALSASLLPFTGHQPFLLRLVRLLRIVRIARLGRFSAAMQSVLEALAERRYELLVSVMIAGMLILTAATLLYFVEGGVQPQAFGSIPRAMWWSVVTLTTVGYGDAAPVTPVGRVLAALTCVGGIGLIAMPTGILAAAFSDAMRRKAEGEAAPLTADPGAAGQGEPAGRRSGGTDPNLG